MKDLISLIPEICRYLNENETDARVYENSFVKAGETKLLMIKTGRRKIILAAGSGDLYNELIGEEVNSCKVCLPNHQNRLILNKYLDYTVPKAFGKDIATFGLGDRLGLISAAHIKVTKDRKIKPLLAQQSKRELDLTGRTYNDVLDDVCYAVMQEGYKGGFGADGDHLKDEGIIKVALDSGYSMITLDCSEKIDFSAEKMEEYELLNRYDALPLEVRHIYEDNYLGKNYFIGMNPIIFTREILARNVLIYGKAIDFTEYIYKNYIQRAGRKIDFEVSVDETVSPTSLHGHYLIANELIRRNVEITSMAPRFVGEFQKGIDYIGNAEFFDQDCKAHAEVADHFGYKLSIHSGSDKFSVYKSISRNTGGRVHVKTAGTNWLEAVRLIAQKNCDLYRRIHGYAFEHFDEAKAYYHVTTDLSAIKDILSVPDSDLAKYMDDNARQLLHITYGILLEARNNGSSMFKDEIFETLDKYSDEYEKLIMGHIGKHLDLLNC